ncbi:uncharacterized protein [Venturia canescens]|uniref:uncharacterized protein n=1 Tax=Venturia canescens TaxID=32260 RepID=UPI001C9C5E92|nr:uncharacterized protein LOC122407387 [Venturia canescens]
MEIGRENVDPNCAQSVLLEHDYSTMFCHNNDNSIENVHKVNDGIENDKKFHTAFKTVDKWADNVILRLSTDVDRKKIVDREITIHKVKYPFLPEQQIRGKVYKKFGIPTVMGSLLSRKRDRKKMVDTKKWHSIQDLSENEDKVNEKNHPSASSNFKNDLQLKPEPATSELLDQVSISSQPTQIVPFVFEASTSILEKPNMSDSTKILKGSMENILECDLGDLPTQKYECSSRNFPELDINGNSPARYFLQVEKTQKRKRKMNESPPAKMYKNERNCKKMKISENLPTTYIPTEKMPGKKRKISVSPTVAPLKGNGHCKKTKISGLNVLENSQDRDIITLDHSYSSSNSSSEMNEKSQKLPSFSIIAKKSRGLFYGNSGVAKSAENDSEDKENGENNLRKGGGGIVLNEFSELGKNILSPIVFSPVPNLTIDSMEISPEKQTFEHFSKSSNFCGISSKRDTTLKRKNSTNFNGSDTFQIPDDSEVEIRPTNSGSCQRDMSHVFVNDLSSRCCEYDRDLTETSKWSNSANYFHNLELISKNVLKIHTNPEEFEIREKVEELLQSLQNEQF